VHQARGCSGKTKKENVFPPCPVECSLKPGAKAPKCPGGHKMKKFLVAVAFMLFSSVSAMACDRALDVNCGAVVQDVQYQGGGVIVETVQATACFDIKNEFGERRILDAISDRNGPFPYTVDFVYNPSRGSYEIIKTVKNGSPCWTHNVPVGTWMAVYVTCRSYTDWVAVQVTGPGTYTMVKVPWSFVEVLP